MKLLTMVSEMVEAGHKAERPLALVPTMGYLHDGHLELMKLARAESATVVVSIFVNPTQFGPSEDLESYPQDFNRDLEMLEQEGVDVVFAPPASEIYPFGHSTYVDVGDVGARLEGKHRPGHFRGVATVVAKLFSIVRPDRSYFGQKDGQQVIVIKQLVRELNLGVKVTVLPTVREPDGLAMSSRNTYLTDEERCAAPVLYRALVNAKELWDAGQAEADILRSGMKTLISKEPLAQIDYVSVADAVTLEELEYVNRPAMVSLAVRFSKARLIDNILIGDSRKTL